MSLDQDIARLARTAPFDLLPADALKLIAFSAERKKFVAGESLFEQGEEADCAYFLLSGSAILTAHGEGPAKRKQVGAGALLGEMAMLASTKRPASAKAREDGVALRIPRHVIHRVLAEFPGEAARMRSALADRARQMAAELDAVRKRAKLG
jgi:CRP-like cAMP-binding protein